MALISDLPVEVLDLIIRDLPWESRLNVRRTSWIIYYVVSRGLTCWLDIRPYYNSLSKFSVTIQFNCGTVIEADGLRIVKEIKCCYKTVAFWLLKTERILFSFVQSQCDYEIIGFLISLLVQFYERQVGVPRIHVDFPEMYEYYYNGMLEILENSSVDFTVGVILKPNYYHADQNNNYCWRNTGPPPLATANFGKKVTELTINSRVSYTVPKGMLKGINPFVFPCTFSQLNEIRLFFFGREPRLDTVPVFTKVLSNAPLLTTLVFVGCIFKVDRLTPAKLNLPSLWEVQMWAVHLSSGKAVSKPPYTLPNKILRITCQRRINYNTISEVFSFPDLTTLEVNANGAVEDSLTLKPIVRNLESLTLESYGVIDGDIPSKICHKILQTEEIRNSSLKQLRIICPHRTDSRNQPLYSIQHIQNLESLYVGIYASEDIPIATYFGGIDKLQDRCPRLKNVQLVTEHPNNAWTQFQEIVLQRRHRYHGDPGYCRETHTFP
jgi:hypothetical protein